MPQPDSVPAPDPDPTSRPNPDPVPERIKAEQIVDRAATGRILVFGSLPPEARDLDLLVPSTELDGLAAALAGAGFESSAGEWVRFAGCSVEVVDLVPAEDWDLPPAALGRLLEDARPVPGFERLVRPAPRDALLILARRLAGGDGRLDAKRRARLERALEEDPDAWAAAQAAAPDWGAVLALEQLREVHSTGVPAPRHARVRAIAEHRGRAGRSRLRATAAGWRRQLPSRRRGRVIALSGLDGAGKSSQARALEHTLERLGYEATIAWTRITYDGWVWRLAWPAKRFLNRPLAMLTRRGRPPPAGPSGDALTVGLSNPGPELDRREGADAGGSEGAPEAAGAEAADLVKRVREGSALLTELWTAVIALANGTSQLRLTRGELRRGRIVICDRYTLDSIVALRFLYGPDRQFGFARLLIRWLSPRPLRAYLLDVSAETAFARKGEEDVSSLARHAELYRAEHESLGVRRLDGERPQEELCAEIARDVWRALA